MNRDISEKDNETPDPEVPGKRFVRYNSVLQRRPKRDIQPFTSILSKKASKPAKKSDQFLESCNDSHETLNWAQSFITRGKSLLKSLQDEEQVFERRLAEENRKSKLRETYLTKLLSDGQDKSDSSSASSGKETISERYGTDTSFKNYEDTFNNSLTFTDRASTSHRPTSYSSSGDEFDAERPYEDNESDAGNYNVEDEIESEDGSIIVLSDDASQDEGERDGILTEISPLVESNSSEYRGEHDSQYSSLAESDNASANDERLESSEDQSREASDGESLYDSDSESNSEGLGVSAAENSEESSSSESFKHDGSEDVAMDDSAISEANSIESSDVDDRKCLEDDNSTLEAGGVKSSHHNTADYASETSSGFKQSDGSQTGPNDHLLSQHLEDISGAKDLSNKGTALLPNTASTDVLDYASIAQDVINGRNVSEFEMDEQALFKDSGHYSSEEKTEVNAFQALEGNDHQSIEDAALTESVKHLGSEQAQDSLPGNWEQDLKFKEGTQDNSYPEGTSDSEISGHDPKPAPTSPVASETKILSVSNTNENNVFASQESLKRPSLDNPEKPSIENENLKIPSGEDYTDHSLELDNDTKGDTTFITGDTTYFSIENESYLEDVEVLPTAEHGNELPDDRESEKRELSTGKPTEPSTDLPSLKYHLIYSDSYYSSSEEAEAVDNSDEGGANGDYVPQFNRDPFSNEVSESSSQKLQKIIALLDGVSATGPQDDSEDSSKERPIENMSSNNEFPSTGLANPITPSNTSSGEASNSNTALPEVPNISYSPKNVGASSNSSISIEQNAVEDGGTLPRSSSTNQFEGHHSKFDYVQHTEEDNLNVDLCVQSKSTLGQAPGTSLVSPSPTSLRTSDVLKDFASNAEEARHIETFANSSRDNSNFQNSNRDQVDRISMELYETRSTSNDNDTVLLEEIDDYRETSVYAAIGTEPDVSCPESENEFVVTLSVMESDTVEDEASDVEHSAHGESTNPNTVSFSKDEDGISSVENAEDEASEDIQIPNFDNEALKRPWDQQSADEVPEKTQLSNSEGETLKRPWDEEFADEEATNSNSSAKKTKTEPYRMFVVSSIDWIRSKMKDTRQKIATEIVKKAQEFPKIPSLLKESIDEQKRYAFSKLHLSSTAYITNGEEMRSPEVVASETSMEEMTRSESSDSDLDTSTSFDTPVDDQNLTEDSEDEHGASDELKSEPHSEDAEYLPENLSGNTMPLFISARGPVVFDPIDCTAIAVEDEESSSNVSNTVSSTTTSTIEKTQNAELSQNSGPDSSSQMSDASRENSVDVPPLQTFHKLEPEQPSLSESQEDMTAKEHNGFNLHSGDDYTFRNETDEESEKLLQLQSSPEIDASDYRNSSFEFRYSPVEIEIDETINLETKPNIFSSSSDQESNTKTKRPHSKIRKPRSSALYLLSRRKRRKRLPRRGRKSRI